MRVSRFRGWLRLSTLLVTPSCPHVPAALPGKSLDPPDSAVGQLHRHPQHRVSPVPAVPAAPASSLCCPPALRHRAGVPVQPPVGCAQPCCCFVGPRAAAGLQIRGLTAEFPRAWLEIPFSLSPGDGSPPKPAVSWGPSASPPRCPGCVPAVRRELGLQSAASPSTLRWLVPAPPVLPRCDGSSQLLAALGCCCSHPALSISGLSHPPCASAVVYHPSALFYPLRAVLGVAGSFSRAVMFLVSNIIPLCPLLRPFATAVLTKLQLRTVPGCSSPSPL